jgi:broad specificity phosphatase PhoE
LTPEGIIGTEKAAKALKHYLGERELDVAFSSKLLRSQETLIILAKKLNLINKPIFVFLLH